LTAIKNKAQVSLLNTDKRVWEETKMKVKATRRRSGQMMITVKLEFHADFETVVACVVDAMGSNGDTSQVDSRSKILALVCSNFRDLGYNMMSKLMNRDNYEDDYGGEARVIVRHFFPDFRE
jgi:hypothetical protein